MWIKRILWVLTIAWMTVIFLFSAQPAEDSAELSRSVTKQVIQELPGVRSLDEEKKQETVDKVHNKVRKIAHFFNFSVLGFLLFLLCKSYGLSVFQAALLALCVSVCYAATDEFHQKFIPGRSCEFRDILIDGGGAAAGMLVYGSFGYLIQRLIRYKSINNA